MAQVLDYGSARISGVQRDCESQPHGPRDDDVVRAEVWEPNQQLLVLVDRQRVVGYNDWLAYPFDPKGVPEMPVRVKLSTVSTGSHDTLVLYWTRPQTFNTMGDSDVDNPAFESDDWEEDIGGNDVLSNSLHDDMSSEGATIQTSSLQQELLQTAVDDYYNQIQWKSLTPALGRDPGKFELVDDRLRLKAYPNVEIVNKRTGAPRALSTVANLPGGGVAIREELGFVDWARKKVKLAR